MEQINPGLSSGTLITMQDDYQKPIEKIKVGDVIKTFDMASEDYDGAHPWMNTPTYTTVRNIKKQRATKLVKIKFSDGTDLITTIGHPLRMQAMPCGIVYREDGIETRGCSDVDEGMEEYDRVGARAKMITDIDDVDDYVQALGYHFCCNVGLESYSPDKKYTENKYDIDDLRFNNVVTMNEWETSQLQIGGFPILGTGKAIEAIRKDVDGDYTELVKDAVTIVGFEDIDDEFETYFIGSTDINSKSNNYFANNVLVTTDKGPQNNEQEHD
jgi:hypothetical protein